MRLLLLIEGAARIMRCRWMAATALQEIWDLKAIDTVNSALAREPKDAQGIVEEQIEGS